MRIGHNLQALNTFSNLKHSSTESMRALEKLSSGYRINRAADDAAGLAISEKMRGQIRGLQQASRNAQDGISLIQTAEGALNEVHQVLQRMRELAVQASNDTNTLEDREKIQSEINQLLNEIDNIANTTQFNTMKLLDGTQSAAAAGLSPASTMSLKELLDKPTDKLNLIYFDITDEFVTGKNPVGDAVNPSYYPDLQNLLKTQLVPQAVKGVLNAFAPAFNYLQSSSIGIGLRLYTESSNVLAYVKLVGYQSGGELSLAYQLGVNLNSLDFVDGQITDDSRTQLETTIVHEMVDFSVETFENAQRAIEQASDAINKVSAIRSNLGAFQNRLEYSINYINNANENLQQSESRIRDMDMAKGMMEQVKYQILVQAGQSMLSQANQSSRHVLELLS